jgi:TonB-dependent receptor
VVVDAEQGDPLIGATIAIVGTTQGTAADLEGRYRLASLDPGEYDIRFSYTGYQAKTVEGVSVEAGETTRLDIDLTSETSTLSEVTVTAQAARDSEAGLLRQRQRASGVSDAISAEAIGRSGAGNAADAMSKVTGASVLEGKYVNMRGLQGRYVDMQLNGTDLPSSDPDGNSVALDLFPSNIIDNIVATKTFTPDRAGNFTGGSIDIATKALPDQFFFNASISSSFNTEVGLGGDVMRPTGGLNAVPDAAQGDLPSTLGQAFNDDAAADRLNAATRAFATPIIPAEESVVGNQSIEIATGNQFEVLNGRALGVIGSFSYDRSFDGFSDGTTARFQQVGVSSETLNPTADFTTQKGVEERLWSGFVAAAFQITPQHEIGARLLYNTGTEEEARTESGALPRDLSGDQVFQTRALRTTERSVRSGQLRGTHQFGDEGLRAEWSASLAQTTRDEPDYRFFSNQFSTAGADTTFGISRSIYRAPTRFFRDLTEDNQSAKLTLTLPVGEAQIKSGGQLTLRSRTFREQRFEHLSDEARFQGSPNAYINEQAGLIGRDERGRNQFGTYVLDRTQPTGNYDGEQDVYAGFAMAEVPVPGVETLEFIGGVRVEHTDMSIATVDNSRTGEFQTTDLLPSANLVWEVQPDMNLRAAYGRTLARPSFREFAPFNSFNFVGDYVEIGNPDLTRTRIHNLDLRWEWFMRGGELLSVGGFYKSFTDPIERTVDPLAAGSDVVVEYLNKSSATVYGLEVEARTQLDRLASWLRYVQVGANVSLIQSQVDRSEEELDAIRAFDDNPSTTRQLQGQSPYLVNLNVSYENPDSGTSLNVLYNRFGERLDTVTRNGLDIFEEARGTLDVTASQALMHGITLKASVKNVLDAEYVTSQSFRGTTFVNDRNPLGRTVSVGVSYGL